MSLKTPQEKLEVHNQISLKYHTQRENYYRCIPHCQTFQFLLYKNWFCTLQIKSKNYLLTLKAIKCSSVQPEHRVSINELKDAIFSLDINKNPDFDGISFTVLVVLLSFINHCYMYLIYLQQNESYQMILKLLVLLKFSNELMSRKLQTNIRFKLFF